MAGPATRRGRPCGSRRTRATCTSSRQPPVVASPSRQSPPRCLPFRHRLEERSLYLMRIGAPGAEMPVVRLDDEHYVDVSDLAEDFDEAFFGGGGLGRIRPVVAERAASGLVSRFAGERVGAPIAGPHQILCIGLNYRDHAAESGQAVPDEPILSTKSPNTLIGPNDDVRIPRASTKTDWEVELGVVIGRRTSYLDSVDEARESIAGFLVVNDV